MACTADSPPSRLAVPLRSLDLSGPAHLLLFEKAVQVAAVGRPAEHVSVLRGAERVDVPPTWSEHRHFVEDASSTSLNLVRRRPAIYPQLFRWGRAALAAVACSSDVETASANDRLHPESDLAEFMSHLLPLLYLQRGYVSRRDGRSQASAWQGRQHLTNSSHRHRVEQPAVPEGGLRRWQPLRVATASYRPSERPTVPPENPEPRQNRQAEKQGDRRLARALGR